MSVHPLAHVGFDGARAAEFAALGDPSLEPARVTRVDRGRITVLSSAGEDRLPASADVAVGDFVAIAHGDGVRSILQRRTALLRRVGEHGDRCQVAAANVDRVLVVRALDTALRPTRIQALVTIAYESGAEPFVLLTKADCHPDPIAAAAEVAEAALGVPVVPVSVLDGSGLDELRAVVAGRTVVLLGESGAGKSTITNLLAEQEALVTGEVRRDGQGRHTTTHRELVPIAGGGAIIDTPGIREAGLWGGEEAIARAFADVEDLAASCRFSDCSHTMEPGCAVRLALRDGTLVPARLEAYNHALRETAWLERRLAERVRSEERAAMRESRRRSGYS